MDQHHPHEPEIEAVVLCTAEDARDVMRYWLSELQVTALATLDGTLADITLRNPSCRLLVIDRVMPPWPGVTEFLALRDKNPALRIAFIENGSIHTTNLAKISGATDVLPRPLSRKHLEGVLAHAMMGVES